MPYRMTPSVRHRAIEVYYYYYYLYVLLFSIEIRGQRIILTNQCFNKKELIIIIKIDFYSSLLKRVNIVLNYLRVYILCHCKGFLR